MTQYEIVVMPGDGIGVEVIDAALAVLKECQKRYGLKLNYTFSDLSADLYRRTGRKITPADMDEIGKADAVLFGAMGLPDVRGPDGLELGAQVEMRAYYKLFASLRPARLFEGVESRVKAKHIDMLVIRETYEGMMVAIPPAQWQVFGSLSEQQLAELLQELAGKMVLARYRKHPRGPKKKPPPRNRYRNGEHVATSKVLAERKCLK